MSFNLAARLSSLETLTLTDLSLKADSFSPYLTTPLTVSDITKNTILYVDSSSIILNKVTTVNSTLNASSLSASTLTIKGTSDNILLNIGPLGAVFNTPVTMTSTLSAPISAKQKEYVDNSISALIGVGTPATLDTLKEIATALGNNPTLGSNLTASIGAINALINVTGSTTILNTNDKLLAGKYNPFLGTIDTFIDLDSNNFNLYNNKLIVNSTTGVQTTSSLYNRNSIDTMLQNYSQQYYFSSDGSGKYLRLGEFILPNNVTNIKFTITYSVTYPDINQTSIVFIHFCSAAGSTGDLPPNGFNGGAIGYSFGPLLINSSSPSSNNGKLIYFTNQNNTNIFDIWFYQGGIGNCLFEVSGIGLNSNTFLFRAPLNTTLILSAITLASGLAALSVPIYSIWNDHNLPSDGGNASLAGYYTSSYINNNYFTMTGVTQILQSQYYNRNNIDQNFYTKSVVDDYIDAKIDSTYVLEMMYNEGGHNYFIATDSATSTTDAQIIINNAQKTPLVKFDLNGSRFYYPLVAYIFTTLNTNNNPTMIINNDSCTLNVPIISGLNIVKKSILGFSSSIAI